MRRPILCTLLLLLAAGPGSAATRLDVPGGWYGERLPSGAWFVQIRDSHIETSWAGRLELPPGGNFAQRPRLDPVTGRTIAGVGIGDDHVWVWDGRWQDRGVGFGTHAVVFDAFGILHIVRGPGTATGPLGWRYAEGARLVSAESTYADPIRGIWEYTSRVCAGVSITVGQGGDEEGVQALVNGRRVLIEPGVNRSITFGCEGDQLALSWTNQVPHQRVTLLGLTLAELQAYPTYTVPGPVVTPPDPEPEPPPVQEPVSLRECPDGRRDPGCDLVGEIRAHVPGKPTPAQLGAMLNEIAWRGNERIGREEWGLSTKNGGNKCPMPPPAAVWIACDVLHHRPSDTLWDVFASVDDEDPARAARPMWHQTEHHHRPDRPWQAPVAPGGTDPDPDPPPDCAACQARVADLESQHAALEELLATARETAQNAITEANALRDERDRLQRERDELLARPEPRCEAKLWGIIKVPCRVIR